MSEKRIAMLPCAPYELVDLDAWFNDMADEGWQVKGSCFPLCFLVRFEKGEGGPYRIKRRRPAGQKAVCWLPGVGWLERGEPEEEDVSEEMRLSARQSTEVELLVLALVGLGLAYWLMQSYETFLKPAESLLQQYAFYGWMGGGLATLVCLMCLRFNLSEVEKRPRGVLPFALGIITGLFWILCAAVTMCTVWF